MIKKEWLYLLLFLASVTGLLIVQYQYLQVGLVLANAQFSDKMDKVKSQVQQDLSEFNALTYSLNRSILQNTARLQINLDSLQKMNTYYLNDYLKYQLQNEGINTSYSFVLRSKDSVIYLKSAKEYTADDNTFYYNFPIKGYLKTNTEKDLVLQLAFHNVNSYFLSQLNGLTIPGFIFVLLIILVVIWVLKSYYWQSQLITTTNSFINNLTHELKTPVFSIKLATKILEERIPVEEQLVLRLIKRESDRLLGHINKVLDLASLEAGKKIVSLQEMDLKPILEKIREDYMLLDQQGLLKFNCSFEDGPYIVKGEPSHLESAVLNILDNARKYAANPVIDLKAEKTGGKLKLVIQDNGIGISKKELKNIFKKYYRVLKDDVHPVTGYGLGLAYVSHIMKLHKIKMEVASEPGRGTRFILWFKLLKSNEL